MKASPAGWVSKVLVEESDQTHVVKATEIAPNLLAVERAEQSDFVVDVTSVRRVTYDDVEPFIKSDHNPSFLVNIPKEAIWVGEAIEALQSSSVAFGGMGDLHRAIREDDPCCYVFKEYAYVERRLRQHRGVSSVDRLFDRVWRVHRRSRDALNVAISDKYDLTADEVRAMHERCGPFNVLFHTNNIGRITNEAQAAARELDIDLVSSGELYERLGR